MRLNPVRLLIALLACLALVAVALPGSARADEPAPPATEQPAIEPLPAAKVEKPLVELVAEANDPNREVHLIVFGSSQSLAFRTLAQDAAALPLIGALSATVKLGYLDELAADPQISFLLSDRPVVQTGGEVDYSQLVPFYPTIDRAHKAWDKGYTGRGVGIAVIDSGVAPLADFAGRLQQVTLPSQTWENEDTHGHGSLVAGIAAGRSADGKFIGVAPEATVYALNVNNPEGVRTSDLIEALQWVFEHAHEHNIRVVNLSLTESVPSSYMHSVLDLAVERLWAAGIVVVVAAGNLGPLPGAVDFAPANDPLAITVGASDSNGTKLAEDDILAGFSSLGVSLDGFGKPELIAPGRLIASVLHGGTVLDGQAPQANRIAPGYATISGTSFSAPQVAGAAAVLLQRYPGWSPDQVKGTLIRRGRLVLGSIVPGLSLHSLEGSEGNPVPANQGVPALVCAPGSSCLPDTGLNTIASSWSSATWNSATWNSATWNSATWNSATWNSATWNSATWNSGTWNSGTWNSGTWNSGTWNSGTWNSGTWNSGTWN